MSSWSWSFTTVGNVSYSLPVPSARSLAGGEAAPTSIGVNSIYTSAEHPATQNNIIGWVWDERLWSKDSEENLLGFVPINFDASTSGLIESYFQKGIGSYDDLKVNELTSFTVSGLNLRTKELWVGNIQHGHYFDGEDEHYLYSDDSTVQYITYSGIVTTATGHTTPALGFNTLTLEDRLKPTIPISASSYQWNSAIGKYEKVLDLRKVPYFSGLRDSGLVRQDTYVSATETTLWDLIDQDLFEFRVDQNQNPPVVIFNNQYVEEVTEVLSEKTTGATHEQFHLSFSPIDDSMSVDVSTYMTSSGISTTWESLLISDTVSGLVPSGLQVLVDPDLGTIEFGDPVDGAILPQPGSTIAVSYWKTLRVEYETIDTNDGILGTTGSVNPIYKSDSNGFIVLSREERDPATISLRAQLDQQGNNVYGPVYIGNSYASIVATVKSKTGKVLEGLPVTFRITSSPILGYFSGANNVISSPTDVNGEAFAFYTPPSSIDELGEVVDPSGLVTTAYPTNPSLSGIAEVTKLTVTEFPLDNKLNEIFLYKVWTDDPILGWKDPSIVDETSAQIDAYYDAYFTDQGIVGDTATTEWEALYRDSWDLQKPAIFGNTNTGRKQLVAYPSGLFFNPHTLVSGAVGPIQPVYVQKNGTNYDVYYDTTEHDIPVVPSGLLYSYFIAGPSFIKLQAEVYNERTNKTLTSNEITVQIGIPDNQSGLWIIDAINQTNINEINHLLASGLVTIGDKIPLGFRLRSSNVSLAAALDGVTFLDVNPRWNYDPYDPDEKENNSLGISFTVV